MKYKDFIIKDGKFIGKFEEMYKKFDDPWLLLKNEKKGNLNYKIICTTILEEKKIGLTIL